MRKVIYSMMVSLVRARVGQDLEGHTQDRLLDYPEGGCLELQIGAGDVAGEIARLKAEPGKDLALGGAKLAATFMKLDLIDEYQLFLQPVVLGSGSHLFSQREKPLTLRLLEARIFASGDVYLRYQANTWSYGV